MKKSQGQLALSKVKKRGDNCLFHGDAVLHNPDNIILESNVRIGDNCFIHALGGVTIGKNTQISRNVLIYTCNHNINGNAIPYDDTYILKSVNIGSSVWIGMNVIITPGVTIGDGAVIGMGTVVSKDVQSGQIVVGSHQRVVNERNMKDFYKHDNNNNLFSVKWPDK
ncbi:DapH/DapD/GlmU-related protein [Vibrio sp. Evd11]|uniref:acyltransferase n=1 Tax=Vibrio sp. Evd11 TaxID=1207404 RepID=UPI0013C4EE70|nr:acyltransferase [Vibrio sp. Evd11]